jgi:hypothetical protein
VWCSKTKEILVADQQNHRIVSERGNVIVSNARNVRSLLWDDTHSILWFTKTRDPKNPESSCLGFAMLNEKINVYDFKFNGLPATVQSLNGICWSPFTPNTLFVGDNNDQQPKVYSVNTANGITTPLAMNFVAKSLRGFASSGPYDASKDLKRVAFFCDAKASTIWTLCEPTTKLSSSSSSSSSMQTNNVPANANANANATANFMSKLDSEIDPPPPYDA